MSIFIREMSENDIPAVVEIIWKHEEFDGQCAQKYYNEFFFSSDKSANERERNFVAVDENSCEVVGMCGFLPDKYNTSNILWLNWLYVRKDYRGQGIGAMLLKFILSEIRKLKGITKVYLDTSNYSSYAKAVNLYKKFGFRIEGNLIDYYGDGENFVIMGFELKDYDINIK